MAEDASYYGGIDTDALVKGIEERAVAGLRQTLHFVEERARHYAPIRKIFDQTYSPRRTALPGLNLASNLNSEQTMRVFRKNRINTAAKYEQFRRSQQRRHEIQTFTAGRVRGHANTETGVFRGFYGKGSALTANLRLINSASGELEPTRPYKSVRAGRIATLQPPTTAEDLGLLTSAGRYEVKHRRGAISTKNPNLLQIGGGLKRSIKVIGPQRVSRGWKGWVQAGNEKVTYARYQEFGTRHHRAQPFLRPALYEGRRHLVNNVSKAIDPRFVKVKSAS